MKQVQLVAPGHIHVVWPTVRGLLNLAIINFDNADYDVEHLKVLLVKDIQKLFVVIEDSNIIGAFTVEIDNQPNYLIAHTTCMGGKGIFDIDTINQYEEWCKSQGITKIRAYAQDSQARLFKMKLGLEKVTNVVEKTL